ncbi:MAG TPA: twin-arginine translocation signal domain-containing protein, partial [bacterium]
MRGEGLLDEHAYGQVRTDQFIDAQARAAGVSRRRFLEIVTAGAGAAAIGGLRPRAASAQAPSDLVVKPTPPEFFNDLGSNKEMRWEVMYSRGYVVPNELFFVRNHSRTARLDAATWRLRVEGSGVEEPREFTYDEILGLPSVSVMRF